jgi:DNA-binding transcriptional regulator GbsR (MarR family)
LGDWKRELKKEEKRREIKYTKRVRKEAIEKSLQHEMNRKNKPKKEGPLKSIESELKHVEETVKNRLLTRNGKKKNGSG